MSPIEGVLLDYQDAIRATGNEVAAALLVLASSVERVERALKEGAK